MRLRGKKARRYCWTVMLYKVSTLTLPFTLPLPPYRLEPSTHRYLSRPISNHQIPSPNSNPLSFTNCINIIHEHVNLDAVLYLPSSMYVSVTLNYPQSNPTQAPHPYPVKGNQSGEDLPRSLLPSNHLSHHPLSSHSLLSTQTFQSLSRPSLLPHHAPT